VRLSAHADWTGHDREVAAIAEARTYLETIRAPLIRTGLTVRMQVLPGEPIRSILFAAHAVEADLISMATHGDTGLRRALIGSVAEGVTRHADMPVLLTRAACADMEAIAPYRSIVVGLDGTPFAETALEYLQAAGIGRAAQIVLAQAVQRVQLSPLPEMVPNEMMASVYAEADRLTEQRRLSALDYLQSIARSRMRGQRWRARVGLDDPASMLVEVASEERADLIVVTTHGRHGMDQLLNGSVAHDLLGTALTPILILHGRNVAFAASDLPVPTEATMQNEQQGEPIARGQLTLV
jgi:nucleotide-binding universal stress UspA family protein